MAMNRANSPYINNKKLYYVAMCLCIYLRLVTELSTRFLCAFLFWLFLAS